MSTTRLILGLTQQITSVADMHLVCSPAPTLCCKHMSCKRRNKTWESHLQVWHSTCDTHVITVLLEHAQELVWRTHHNLCIHRSLTDQSHKAMSTEYLAVIHSFEFSCQSKEGPLVHSLQPVLRSPSFNWSRRLQPLVCKNHAVPWSVSGSLVRLIVTKQLSSSP